MKVLVYNTISGAPVTWDPTMHFEEGQTQHGIPLCTQPRVLSEKVS